MIQLNVYRSMSTRALRLVYHSIHYLPVTVYGQPMDLVSSGETAGLPSPCVHCRKRIVLHPGTDRYRSTEHGIAVDRMRCAEASDGHHHPGEPALFTPAPMRHVTPHVSPEPQFRTGDPA